MFRNTVQSLIVLAAFVLATLPAAAQSPTYFVEARAYTGGTPGAYNTYSGPHLGQTSTSAVADPAGTAWIYNVNQQLYSDAASTGVTRLGVLEGYSSTLAQRIQATNFPGPVTASTYSRFRDWLTVESDTLPKNTPVTLTFRAELGLGWQGVSLYDGTSSCNLQVGPAYVVPKWSVSYKEAEVPASTRELTVNTTVGSRIQITALLLTSARAWFFVSGPRYDGEMEVGATCRTPFVGASGDVRLVSDSGTDYANLPL